MLAAKHGKECMQESPLGTCVQEQRNPQPPQVRGSIRAAEALTLFELSRTQWRVGFGGPTGLDYLAVKEVAALQGYDWADLYPLVRRLESEWLSFLDEKRKADEAKRAADAKKKG